MTSEDVSADIDGHGVLAEMLMSFVKGQGVVTLSLVTLSLTAENVSAADDDGHGVLAEMLIS